MKKRFCFRRGPGVAYNNPKPLDIAITMIAI